jgi:8-oxo-dGTP pyrophosphatase MutT (NUDIX family)
MADRAKIVEPWEVLGQERLCDCRIFSLTRRRSRSPRTGAVHEFSVIESPDWVNIVPLTPEREVVMVYQYRHGIDRITLEIPGGLIDAEDPSPLEAARREMREESGYDSSEVAPLGRIHPNPAIQNNHCYSFVAKNVVRRYEMIFDGTEHTEVVLVPLERIPDLIRDGTISHALVVVAFHWLLLTDG